MAFKSNGNLEKLRRNLSALSQTTEIKLTDLMDSQFISGCSKYANVEELFESSGFKIESEEYFLAIPDDEWEEFIVKNTTFSSWDDMQQAAASAYTKKKIMSGLK